MEHVRAQMHQMRLAIRRPRLLEQLLADFALFFAAGFELAQGVAAQLGGIGGLIQQAQLLQPGDDPAFDVADLGDLFPGGGCFAHAVSRPSVRIAGA
jgi:hypothetical protein